MEECESGPVVLVELKLTKALLPSGDEGISFEMEGGATLTTMLGMLEYVKMLILADQIGEDE